MAFELELQRIGDGVGFIFSAKLTAKLKLVEGDKLWLKEIPGEG